MTQYGTNNPRTACILECDSPSYPPEITEYLQCSCKVCLKYLASKGYNLIKNGKIIEPRTVSGSLD